MKSLIVALALLVTPVAVSQDLNDDGVLPGDPMTALELTIEVSPGLFISGTLYIAGDIGVVSLGWRMFGPIVISNATKQMQSTVGTSGLCITKILPGATVPSTWPADFSVTGSSISAAVEQLKSQMDSAAGDTGYIHPCPPGIGP